MDDDNDFDQVEIYLSSDIDKEYEATLARAGFTTVPYHNANFVMWYHPTHWRPAPEGEGDVGLFDVEFKALTEDARNHDL